MKRWGHGLVIGKFRPPHKGHGLLIETGLAQVDRLTVLVCADASDSIPADLRAAWLRELYPAVDVRVVETTGYDPDDSTLWARLTRGWLSAAPDVVFTSEAYGPVYARHLGCAHVAVDPERVRVPVAGSRILADPAVHRATLEPPVRAYFVPRVVLVGAESTGKTTLARALAARYGTTWVPEYGRTFWDGLLTLPHIAPTTADFVHIAETQRRLEDQLARHADRVLVCDTDAFCTWLWHQRYIGADAPVLRALADTPRWRALYVLTGDEIPWEDDGTRDRREERAGFHRRFREELERHGRPFIHVDGLLERRLATLVSAADRFCEVRVGFGSRQP
jgi:HTH-type transcriptional regulator, transcriptional repressor of NAD biosynthesis genes